MMPPAQTPFSLGQPPQPLNRDNMPLPYGEHHLMQVSPYPEPHAAGDMSSVYGEDHVYPHRPPYHNSHWCVK